MSEGMICMNCDGPAVFACDDCQRPVCPPCEEAHRCDPADLDHLKHLEGDNAHAESEEHMHAFGVLGE